MQRMLWGSGCLFLWLVLASASTYDDYSFNNYAGNNQYQTSFQYQSYSSPQLNFYQLNFTDDFLKNPAYTAVVKGYESNGGLKDFLADKVAPNINVQNFVGSQVANGSAGVSFSSTQNQYLVKSYDNVKLDSSNQIKQFDAFTSRGDFTQREQISQIQYNPDKLVANFQVQTQDIAGNVCQQRVENICYQTNPDSNRYQNLVQYAQNKAEQPGTYGFEDMVQVIKEFPEPAKQLPKSMDLTITPPRGVDTQMKVSNMHWQQEKLVGFDALITQGKEQTTVSMEVKLNSHGQAESLSLETNGNKQTITVDGNHDLEAATQSIFKSINPVALLAGSDIQMGEGKVVYLAQNYNEQGQLSGASKNKSIDFGKPGFLEDKASIDLKQDLKNLEQTAPGITRDVVWDQDVKHLGAQQLTNLKTAIGNRIEKSLDIANQQTTIKTAWGGTITKPSDHVLKLENNRITSNVLVETPEGTLTNITFKLQDNQLQAVSATLTKADKSQVSLGVQKPQQETVQAAKDSGGFIQAVGSFFSGVGKAIGSVVNTVGQGISTAWQTVSSWFGGKTPQTLDESKARVADNAAGKKIDLANLVNARSNEITRQGQELGQALARSESVLSREKQQISLMDQQNTKLKESNRVLEDMLQSLGYKVSSIAMAKDAYTGLLTDEIQARVYAIQSKTEKMGQAINNGDLPTAAKLGQEIQGMQTRFDERAASIQGILSLRTEGAKVLLKEVAAVVKAKDSMPEKILNCLGTVYTLLQSDKITPYLYVSLKQQLVSKLDGSNKELAITMLQNDTQELVQAQAIISREVKNIPEGMAKGDFAKPTLGGALGQAIIYFTPAGPLAAVRDATANGIKMIESKGADGKLAFALSVAAIIPAVGEVKALPKLLEAVRAARKAGRLEQAAVGVNAELGMLKTAAVITNALPENGLFARAMREVDANLFVHGNAKFSFSDEVFITAADDLKNAKTPGEIAERLTLKMDAAGTKPRIDSDTIVVFKRSNTDSVSSPINLQINGEPRGWGFKGNGTTAGGAREWLMENGTIQNMRAKGLEIDQIYTVDSQGGKVTWEIAANQDGTYSVLSKGPR